MDAIVDAYLVVENQNKRSITINTGKFISLGVASSSW
jgi:hypothetical protein